MNSIDRHALNEAIKGMHKQSEAFERSRLELQAKVNVQIQNMQQNHEMSLTLI